MKKIENQCVDCGLPCLGSSCPYRNVPVFYCDKCEKDYAEYKVDNMDLCKSCTEKYFQETFNDLSDYEKAEALHIILSNLYF